MSDASWEVDVEDDGARLTLDRPGIQAVSIVLDDEEAKRLILELAGATGLSVAVEPDA